MIGEIDGVKIIATPEQYKNRKKSLEEQLEEKDKEIEFHKNNERIVIDCQNKLNEEIERLNNIINKAIDLINNDDIYDYRLIVDKLLEILKGVDKE